MEQEDLTGLLQSRKESLELIKDLTNTKSIEKVVWTGFTIDPRARKDRMPAQVTQARELGE